MKIINMLLIIIIILAVIQCSQIKSVNGDYNDPNAILLANGSGQNDWKIDPYSINEIEVIGDTLKINLSYSGGCRKHEFKLVAWNYFMESNPVQAGILLSHNSNLDPCERYVTDNLFFILTPLKLEYERDYGSGSAAIIINLKDGEEKRSIKYQF